MGEFSQNPNGRRPTKGEIICRAIAIPILLFALACILFEFYLVVRGLFAGSIPTESTLFVVGLGLGSVGIGLIAIILALRSDRIIGAIIKTMTNLEFGSKSVGVTDDTEPAMVQKSMNQKKDISIDYKNWYTSERANKFLIENIGKSGIPLELRVRKILKDNGFQVTNARYFEPAGEEPELPIGYGQGTWRELDAHASRSEKTFIRIGKGEIHFTTHILAECKYSTEKDLFVFEHLDRENADLSGFPLLVNGQCILPLFPAKHFRLPLLVERVTEIDHRSASKEKGNYSDAITHDACEQILSALRFFLSKWREDVRKHYLNLASASTIAGIWDALRKEGEVPYKTFGPVTKVPDGFINQFLEKNFKPEMLEDFPYFAIHIFFPLLVMDERRGIIRVNLNESYAVTGLQDVWSCLYLYISENANCYEGVLGNSFVLPVLMCNLSNLGRMLKMIEEGMNQVIEATRLYTTTNPHLVLKEIVFSDRVTTSR